MNYSSAELNQSSEFLQKAFRMAVVPGMVSYLSSNLALLADGVLVGRSVGVDGLAAVSLSTPIVLLISLIGGFLSCGAETLCSRALGNSNEKQAQRIYSSQIALMLVFSLIFTAVGLLLMKPITSLLCDDDPVLFGLVYDYSRVYILGAPAMFFTFPPFWFLPLDGKNKSMTAMTLIMGIGNILLDILFLSVFGMGVRGAALASVLSAGAAAAFGMIRLHTGKHTFGLSMAFPKGKEWGNYIAAGSPEAFTNLFQALRVLTVNNILLSMSGGNLLVAQFSVVNAMVSVADAVTVGVPQSGTAILGVYCGEHDNPSTRILLRQQVRIGVICCAALGMLIGFGSPGIEWAYQVGNLRIPLSMLSLSLIPSLLINILTSYYRAYGRSMLANILIALRTYVFCVISLRTFTVLHITPWLFQVAEVLLTLLLWAGLTWVIWRKEKKKKSISRWLLADTKLEDNGNSINFSSPSDEQAICEASEKIGEFCGNNQMAPKQTMRVSLALEEMMALITQMNPEAGLNFDVRVFALESVIGIRIRYGGISFNPLSSEYEDDDRFMGIRMVCSLVEETVYQWTFGVNSLLILVK